jgi:hypothetical protein
MANLGALLATPPLPDPLPPPATTARARAQYREASAETKALEAATLVGGFVARQRAAERVAAAITGWHAVWLSSWPLRCAAVAGDQAAALRLAERLRREGLGALERVFDDLHVGPPKRRPRGRRKAKPKAKVRRRHHA